MKDVYSFNVENSRKHLFNLVIVLMNARQLNTQEAIDEAFKICNNSLKGYVETKAKLPSWGEVVDKQVAQYVSGLEGWMGASVSWHSNSKRYFGDHSETKGSQRVVNILPQNGELCKME